MKLQPKIVILLAVVLGILIMSFLSYQYIQLYEKKLLYQENRRTQEEVIDKVLKISSTKSEQLINDNSGWDDMVRFVLAPDTAWAKDNVDFFVHSFGLSFVLAYDKEGHLIYKYGNSRSTKNLEFGKQDAAIPELAKSPFVHYFQKSGDELVEVFGAVVVPSADADERKTPPQGYLFIGKIWDKDYFDEHKEATGYEVGFLESGAKMTEVDPSRIYIYKEIGDSSGKVVGQLVFSRPDDLKESLNQLFYLSAIFVLLSVLSIAFFLYYFRKTILNPLRKIGNALNLKDAKEVESLKAKEDEFGALAVLIEDFFAQQEILKENNVRLQDINATKDRLFSIIAHDLKNPVGSILSLTELLSKYLKDRDYETMDELVDLLYLHTKETMTLLNSLFDWAKSQTGQMGLFPEHFELKRLVDEVMAGLLPSAHLKGITILEPEIGGTMAYADRNVLKTVVRNLVSNAIKYSHPGDTIHVDANVTAQRTEISVIDTGIGMTDETLEKLFRIESGLSSEGTANEKGNGLGLIICKEMVEIHGGNITVESYPGKGSRFVITLPTVPME